MATVEGACEVKGTATAADTNAALSNDDEDDDTGDFVEEDGRRVSPEDGDFGMAAAEAADTDDDVDDDDAAGVDGCEGDDTAVAATDRECRAAGDTGAPCSVVIAAAMGCGDDACEPEATGAING